ncbi:hypothetical protein GCM10007989_04740 [Devosia pacifica]|uniref:Uncharacterized protein n=1 Tax=Devosia pacifica TaxID=1335967 RepID=A0A918RW28_9HYPH|nr:hypothetical protein [Devosia pacifica]GHA13208.1 hypothetical protein GCM10007989_04740 [Devosia pacifica]
MQWLSSNTELLNLAANWGMLFIWVAYLHLFLQSYRRQTRSKILINRGASGGLDARCLISNMSSDAIYVESIIATLEAGDRRWSASVTARELSDDSARPNDPRELTFQGPLGAGDYLDAGAYGELLDRALDKDRGQSAETLRRLESPVTAQIDVFADYASEDLMIGARRRFNLVEHEGVWQLRPQRMQTQQIRSKSERARIADQLAAD